MGPLTVEQIHFNRNNQCRECKCRRCHDITCWQGCCCDTIFSHHDPSPTHHPLTPTPTRHPHLPYSHLLYPAIFSPPPQLRQYITGISLMLTISMPIGMGWLDRNIVATKFDVGWLYRYVIFSLLTKFAVGVISWHYIVTPNQYGSNHVVTLYFHSAQNLVGGGGVIIVTFFFHSPTIL